MVLGLADAFVNLFRVSLHTWGAPVRSCHEEEDVSEAGAGQGGRIAISHNGAVSRTGRTSKLRQSTGRPTVARRPAHLDRQSGVGQPDDSAVGVAAYAPVVWPNGACPPKIIAYHLAAPFCAVPSSAETDCREHGRRAWTEATKNRQR